MSRKVIDAIGLGVILLILILLLYRVMQYFGFTWFDRPVALVTWGILMAIMIKL